MSKKKKNLKYWTGKIHLWLGLASGLFVCFLGITGCILAFEQEIENLVQDYRFAAVQNSNILVPSEIKKIADKALPNKEAHSISYQTGKSSVVTYYAENADYYYTVFVNPYTGEVLKVKDMATDFFRVVIMGHYYLWLPPNIGQPVLATATLLFTFLLFSGLVLWWPKNRAASKKRFTVKWNAKWRRVNYDIHNVFGFYLTWIMIFLAVTGLVMGFQWFAKSVYWVSSGGKSMIVFEESVSKSAADARLVALSAGKAPAEDILWARARAARPGFTGSMDVHPPHAKNAAIEIAVNPEPGTFWKADYLFYDRYTLEEIKVNHMYGKFKDASVADKIARMNYDVHVGAVLGLPGKIMAFFASLVAASLPITGFIIWRGRNNKKKKAEANV
ncbi:MAG: PepSY domain-containing protein [Pedobacter sp.]|nr:MAG: PepSY domain-containing protein [Pedobacter sp.]